MKKLLNTLLLSCSVFVSTHALAGGGHGKEVEGLPQLDPSSFASQIFWLCITFSFLYILLAKKSLPDVTSVIDNRNERIKNDLDTADRLKSEVIDVQTSYEEKLSSAREQSLTLFKNAEIGAKAKLEEFEANFIERSSQSIVKMESKLMGARSEAMENIAHVSASVAVQSCEKIMGVSPSNEAAEKAAKSLI